ncbi:MAG TPA: aldolase, partial [Balneola sp.]|nr:aldolase [Balneola sp.]
MLKLILITDSPEIAKKAEDSGVDIIMVDLEINGKQKRQGGLNTVISNHSIDAIPKVR